MVRIKILGSSIGTDKIELNGEDITLSVLAFEIKSTVDSLTEVKLTLIADVDAEIEAGLLALEKAQHIRFSTLMNPQGAFLRVK